MSLHSRRDKAPPSPSDPVAPCTVTAGHVPTPQHPSVPPQLPHLQRNFRLEPQPYLSLTENRTLSSQNFCKESKISLMKEECG